MLILPTIHIFCSFLHILLHFIFFTPLTFNPISLPSYSFISSIPFSFLHTSPISFNPFSIFSMWFSLPLKTDVIFPGFFCLVLSTQEKFWLFTLVIMRHKLRLLTCYVRFALLFQAPPISPFFPCHLPCIFFSLIFLIPCSYSPLHSFILFPFKYNPIFLPPISFLCPFLFECFICQNVHLGFSVPFSHPKPPGLILSILPCFFFFEPYDCPEWVTLTS